MTTIWLGYVATGILAGFLGGLLGIGGGLVVVPALAVLLRAQGVPAELVLSLSIGTSLATILFTSGSSVWAHHRRANVDWRLAWRISPGLVAGSLMGTAAAALISGALIKFAFAGYATWTAQRMLRTPAGRAAPADGVVSQRGCAAAGGLIGGLAALTGTSASSMAIAFMVSRSVPMRTAIGTAAALGLPAALAGTAGYAVQGLARCDLPLGCLGYVYLPAVAAIAAVSVAAAPAGAALSQRLPVPVLRRVFALVLSLIAAKTLLSA